MALEEELSKWIKAFYNREIDTFSLYVEGFGGFFLRRTKDGMVIGYLDKNKHFGIDDHVTLFFDTHGLRGMHRKVTDADNVVYMKYNIDYFRSPDGIKKLLQDTQKRNDVPFRIEMLLALLYRTLNWVFDRGMHFRSLKILEDSEARKLGMKSPCIYVKPGYTERILLPIYNKIIQVQSSIHMRKFGKRPSEGFREQNFPGNQITKHPKKEKKT